MTDELLQLMTAAVDGELSATDAQRLRKLLDSSAEARAVFAKLKSDSKRLRGLPRVEPPTDLHTRVMARVATATPPPNTAPARKPEPARQPATVPFAHPRTKSPRRWVPIAVAASLLLVVSASSFWYFTRDRGATVARNPNRPPPATRSGAGDPDWAKWLPADGAGAGTPAPSPRDANNTARRDTPPVLPQDVPAPGSVAIAPEPRVVSPDLIGSRIGLDIPPIEHIDARVPFLRPLTDLDREDVRKQLTDELGRDPAFRIDLFARDPARGVDCLLTAAKAAGATVHADANTMTLLRKRLVTSVVIYTDSFTAAELTDLFVRLSREEAKISPRVFDVLHAIPVAKSDATELREILGTDPGLFKRTIPAPERGEKGIENGKSISAGTADQIVKTITAGQGKPGEKSAVLMTWSSTGRTPPAASAELKTFLAKRGARVPNAVPVIIVIRPGNG
jgi:hypothetical protein